MTFCKVAEKKHNILFFYCRTLYGRFLSALQRSCAYCGHNLALVSGSVYLKRSSAKSMALGQPDFGLRALVSKNSTQGNHLIMSAEDRKYDRMAARLTIIISRLFMGERLSVHAL